MNTADKVLSALSLFTLEKPEWTVEAAAEALDVSASTVYRYFRSLMKFGLVEPTTNGRYVLGPTIIAFDWQLRRQDPLIRTAGPVMKRLVRRNGGEGVALLCRRFRQQVMCVHQAFEHTPDFAVSYERGRPMGLYRGASSLIILANLPSRTIRRLWSDDAAGLNAAGLGSSLKELREGLRKIRTAGTCVTRGHLDKGMIGLAAAIWEPGNQIAGSVGIVMREALLSAGSIAGTSALVMAAAHEVNVGMKELAGEIVAG